MMKLWNYLRKSLKNKNKSCKLHKIRNMSDYKKIYPKGMMTFTAREGAPDFVKGQLVVTMRDFIEWSKTVQEHYREYNGKKQLRFNILDGEKGLYVQLDTWKPDESKKKEPVSESNDDLPF